MKVSEKSIPGCSRFVDESSGSVRGEGSRVRVQRFCGNGSIRKSWIVLRSVVHGFFVPSLVRLNEPKKPSPTQAWSISDQSDSDETIVLVFRRIRKKQKSKKKKNKKNKNQNKNKKHHSCWLQSSVFGSSTLLRTFQACSKKTWHHLSLSYGMGFYSLETDDKEREQIDEVWIHSPLFARILGSLCSAFRDSSRIDF